MAFNDGAFGSSIIVDGVSLNYNNSGALQVNFNGLTVASTFSVNNTNSNIVIASNSNLSGDVYCQNFTINSGITLTTNGYNIICSGTFTNNGTIVAGMNSNRVNYPNSYGGSGGGAGSGLSGAYGQNGYNTVAPGGSGCTAGQGAGAGSTPTLPTISNTLIQNMYANGLSNQLTGAAGGTYATESNDGGLGSYGIYIQCVTFTNNGTITANGYTDRGGGGGGGWIFISCYNHAGSIGTVTSNGGGAWTAGSASGGNGNIVQYNWTVAPIAVSGVVIPSTQGILFTSTITVSTLTSLEIFAPIIIESATAQPATVYLYRGATQLTSIPVYVGSNILYYIDNGIAAGNYTYTIQGVSTASSTAQLTGFKIMQIAGAGV